MDKKPYIVTVNAVSGGGKTTVVRELQRLLPEARALYFDDRDYDSDSGIDDICSWMERGADVNEFNLDRLAGDLDKLAEEGHDYIIMDYPFGYRHKRIAEYIDFSVFIDTPLDIALARRIIRDYDDAKAAHISADMEQYLNQGRSTYMQSVSMGISDADLVVDGGRALGEIVEVIIEAILQNSKPRQTVSSM